VPILRVPPLRERREDIALLAARFADEICRRFGMLPKQLSGEARELLVAHDWRRNNVRELRNVVERMVVAADGEVLRAEHVPVGTAVAAGPAGRPGGSAAGRSTGFAEGPQSWQEQRLVAERRMLLAALERQDGQITRTADALGLADHASLLKIMRRLGVRREG